MPIPSMRVLELEKKVEKLEQEIGTLKAKFEFAIKELYHKGNIEIIIDEENDLEMVKPKKHNISIHGLCDQTKINKKISTKIVRI